MSTARHTAKSPVTVILTVLATLLGLLALGGLAPAQAAAAGAGLHISDGRLVEGNGDDFIMRGVNHAHTWYPGETGSTADIKATGANTVRVVLSDGDRWSRNGPDDVAAVIARCRANRLICVLEVHDTTGYGEDSAAGTLDHAADYWIGLKDVLAGQEDYVVINIGNEPWGNTDPAGWTAPTTAAVKKLRAAGLAHTIMVDAPNWGQDWQNVMRDNAQAVYDADPAGNLLFSIHMYSVYNTAQKVTDYLNAFVDAGLPLVIGEFGGPADQYGDPDEDTMMSEAQRLGLGWIAWSWSGNTDPVLDLAVGFDPARLSPWGERVLHGADGIAQTSREAAVYGGAPSDTEAPTAPGAPAASAVTDTSATLTWAASSDNVAVAGYDVVRVDGATETAAASSATGSVTVTGLSAGTAYSFAVYARDAAGNRSARSAAVGLTTDSGSTAPAGTCSVGYEVVGEWQGGFQGEITIRNTGTAAIDGWTLGFAFADGQTISNMWGGTPRQTGGSVSVTPASYTSAIAPNGTVTVGFTGNRGGTNTPPAAFTLSGAACAAA
ncbi:mannan endo-1,4-beta-mannosidase [Streptomyces sp. 840.1]|uniref:cellulase family glycosylhydrolase n=1 Tax=Streptomyces sp. 840.1 TaxID=2485152 RepID=UPI000F493B94|nr:cellulase family glycosylhydrolase [Streptomyces sp. 840.1]ROQ68430.1 mannan endo-1,4-beta-mannosidase [Streptomyces sp. 840.1]